MVSKAPDDLTLVLSPGSSPTLPPPSDHLTPYFRDFALAWRIPGTAEPGGLPSMGSHRVGHDWSDLAAAAALGSYAFTDVFPTAFTPLWLADSSLFFRPQLISQEEAFLKPQLSRYFYLSTYPAAPWSQCQLAVEEVLVETLNILVAGGCLVEKNSIPPQLGV